MRYYKIEILNTDGSTFMTFSSLASNGALDPGALNVELDIPVWSYNVVAGKASVKIWGISRQTIAQSSNLNGKSIKVSLGMSKGLPLANPAQAKLVISGKILQAFGNWMGVNQTLDLYFYTGGIGAVSQPANFSQNWQAGQQLNVALAQTLQTAFPALTQDIKISPKLVLPNTEPGIYPTLQNLNNYLNELSKQIISDPNYQGVMITINGSKIIVRDGTDNSPPVKAILFNDLIGQPTWIGPSQVQVICVMRGDIYSLDYVSLPQTQNTLTAQSQQPGATKLTFSGQFQVITVRHVGNFRQPDGNSWVTVLDCKAQPNAIAAAAQPNTTVSTQNQNSGHPFAASH